MHSRNIWRLYRDQNPDSIRAMKKSPFHPGPLDQLSREAITALHRIKCGQSITARQYVELEIEDLIRPGLSGWMLTEVGRYRLDKGQ